MKKALYFIIVIVIIGFITYFNIKNEPLPAYNPERNYITNQEEDILTKFLLAKDSTTIYLDEGHFSLSQSLILDGVKKITIKGKGKDKTVLSFKNQTSGAEGIRITNSNNIIIEDLTVEDAKGDNIKVMNVDGITMRNMRSSWTGKVSDKNGAYAYYPVLCKNVVIDNCVSIGASDAGIYVGQSNFVTIKNNEVFYNVAGIESENSGNVKIFDNTVYENTGGILVFDLPGLTRGGNDIEVYNNKIFNNNTKNFAPKGSIVGQTPSGTGCLVLGTERVHIRDNQFINNKTTDIAITSYVLIYEMGKRNKSTETTTANNGSVVGSTSSIDEKFEKDKTYNPYSREIKIGKNIYENNRWFPTINNDFGKILLLKSPLKHVNILWDGVEDPNLKSNNYKYTICLEAQENLPTFLKMDVLNDFKNLSKDGAPYICN